MLNVHSAASHNRRQLTIDGSLELFGQFLTAIHRIAPEAERKTVRTKPQSAPQQPAPYAADADQLTADHWRCAAAGTERGDE
jgi:hypothetical protein